MTQTLTWAFLLSLALTWPGVYAFRQFAPRWGLLDMPNERSMHDRPVPRAGGVVFVIVAPLAAIV